MIKEVIVRRNDQCIDPDNIPPLAFITESISDSTAYVDKLSTEDCASLRRGQILRWGRDNNNSCKLNPRTKTVLCSVQCHDGYIVKCVFVPEIIT